MKTSVNYLEDFIFEQRNKEYGAYYLRKTYLKTLITAVVMGTGIFLSGVSAVWVSNYVKKGISSNEQENITSVMLSNLPKKEAAEIIPELPVAEQKKTVAFRAPIVINTDEEITGELSDMMENTQNINPADTISEVIIEISEEPKKTSVIEEQEEEIKIYTFVEEYPQFPGGDAERINYLRDNLKYPSLAKETGIQGAVYVTFVVEKDGSISNISIIRGIGGGCDEEALRVVSAMPKWNPGRQNGKEVRVQFNMPITFKLM